MSKITLPVQISQQLSKVRGGVRLYDDAGNVIGLFMPAANLVLEPTISEEELDRREKEDGPLYSTSEVIAHLRSL
jgi:hypothetical protein